MFARIIIPQHAIGWFDGSGARDKPGEVLCPAEAVWGSCIIGPRNLWWPCPVVSRANLGCIVLDLLRQVERHKRQSFARLASKGSAQLTQTTCVLWWKKDLGPRPYAPASGEYSRRSLFQVPVTSPRLFMYQPRVCPFSNRVLRLQAASSASSPSLDSTQCYRILHASLFPGFSSRGTSNSPIHFCFG